MTNEREFSDETETCEECLSCGESLRLYGPGNDYRDILLDGTQHKRSLIDGLRIVGPGKFEGEPLSTFHAYHVMLDGGSDDESGQYWRVGNVICYERETGFVDGTVYETEEAAIQAWSELEEELEEELSSEYTEEISNVQSL